MPTRLFPSSETTTGPLVGLWTENVYLPLAMMPAALVKLMGKSMIVGSVRVVGSTIGAPTSTVTPAGVAVKVRSAAERVEKTTGLLKVTWMTLGRGGDGRTGRRVRCADPQQIDSVEGLDRVDQTVAALRIPAFRALPRSSGYPRPRRSAPRGSPRGSSREQAGPSRRPRPRHWERPTRCRRSWAGPATGSWTSRARRARKEASRWC